MATCCVICFEEENQIAPIFCCPAPVCVYCDIILTACVYCREAKPQVFSRNNDSGSDMDLDVTSASSYSSSESDTENALDDDENGGFYFDSTHPHLGMDEEGQVAYH